MQIIGAVLSQIQNGEEAVIKKTVEQIRTKIREILALVKSVKSVEQYHSYTVEYFSSESIPLYYNCFPNPNHQNDR